MGKTVEKTSFELKVDRCREKNLDDLINNAAWEHAQYLYRNLLEVAADNNEKVRIVTGTLNKDFYGDLIEVLEQCISANIIIELIILDAQGFDIKSNPFAKRINDYDKGNVVLADDLIPVPHMLLIGDEGRRFRLEIDHNQTKAIASFNNSDIGSSLIDMYEGLKGALKNRASQTNHGPIPAQ